MSEEVPSDVAQKIIVKFLANENVGPKDIFNRLQAQFGTNCLSHNTVAEYYQSFQQIDHVKKEPEIKIVTEYVCGCSSKYGYAALGKQKLAYTKKFKEIRPAPVNNLKPIALNKTVPPTKKILLPRHLVSKAKSLPNINEPSTAINVLITQPLQLKSHAIEEETNHPKGFKKIAPKLSPVSVTPVITNVVSSQNEDNSENEVPQGINNEVVIESDMLEENNYLTNFVPLAEHRYAITFEEPDETKQNRQGKPLTPEQKILAYNTYIDERINKNCSKSRSIANAAISVSISCGTMWNLVKEMEQNGQFAPHKKRKKRSNCYEILDDTNKNKLQKIVKQLISNGELPTVDKICVTLKNDNNFPQLSRTTVYNQLKKLGFKYEKRGREKILKEKKTK